MVLGREHGAKRDKGIGDVAMVVASNDTTKRLHVVGIVVVNDPIVTQSGAGVAWSCYHLTRRGRGREVAQSI